MENALIFEQILSSNRKRNYTKISLENLCKDFVTLRIKRDREEGCFFNFKYQST